MKPVTVQICVGTHCTMMGAMNLYEALQSMQEEGLEITIDLVRCFGDCKANEAPVVVVNDKKIVSATSEKVMEYIMEVGKV
ncbi:MAG TPA: (2Fe-2S) ferredoxin domain-containing protein [Bacillota bacterium]|nr:(2Fe-2S) ferredoxin domain-containing protein [Bacillota bacterium]HPT87985.1 (2Fe-2S) ferredoxin domain-containing protein [Bacillota bacterium]